METATIVSALFFVCYPRPRLDPVRPSVAYLPAAVSITYMRHAVAREKAYRASVNAVCLQCGGWMVVCIIAKVVLLVPAETEAVLFDDCWGTVAPLMQAFVHSPPPSLFSLLLYSLNWMGRRLPSYGSMMV